MKILIIGSSGPTGRLLVHQALEAGLQVTAFVRNPEAFNVSAPGLTVFKGDALEPEDVKMAVKGHDAVICALGVSAKIPDKEVPPIRSEGTKNIIEAMKENDVNRFICITSMGAGDSKRTSGLFGNVIVPLFWKNRFRDVNLQEKLIFESGLDFTIVRPPALTFGARKGKYRHGKFFTILFASISRADLAAFIIKELFEGRYTGMAVSVQY